MKTREIVGAESWEQLLKSPDNSLYNVVGIGEMLLKGKVSEHSVVFMGFTGRQTISIIEIDPQNNIDYIDDSLIFNESYKQEKIFNYGQHKDSFSKTSYWLAKMGVKNSYLQATGVENDSK